MDRIQTLPRQFKNGSSLNNLEPKPNKNWTELNNLELSSQSPINSPSKQLAYGVILVSTDTYKCEEIILKFWKIKP